MARQWILNSQNGFENSLEYQENMKIPSADELGPEDVLVKMYAASLNYREIMIAAGGINGPIKSPVIPACDGAGVVEAVGSSVQEFRAGDRVITHLAPKIVTARGNDASSTFADVTAMLGQGTDGTLRSHGIFHSSALVHAPTSLEWLPASTLTCNWATAWNIFFGLKGQEVKPGDWVLVQGTGGVSVAALQVAVAAGATVVATTSTEGKAIRLRSLGAISTVNYISNPNGWGEEARSLTPGGRGFDFIVDVGGNESLPQSLAAIKAAGTVVVTGMVGKAADPVPLFACLMHTCVVRGILGGSRNHLQKVARFIDEKGIVPAVDDVVFELAEAMDAYRRLKDKKHFAKVVIRIDHQSN